MTKNIRSRVSSLEAIFGVVENVEETDRSPALIRVRTEGAFAAEVFGQSTRSQADCLAKLYGLKGSGSLWPWLKEGITDTDELARLDYEPEHGAAWRDEWQRQIEDAGIILRGRIGKDWPAVLQKRIDTALSTETASQ